MVAAATPGPQWPLCWQRAGSLCPCPCVWAVPGQGGWHTQQEQTSPTVRMGLSLTLSQPELSVMAILREGTDSVCQRAANPNCSGMLDHPRWGCGKAPECPKRNTVPLLAGPEKLRGLWGCCKKSWGEIPVCSLQEGTTLCRENFLLSPFWNVWGETRGVFLLAVEWH